jgi:dTMP kinase
MPRARKLTELPGKLIAVEGLDGSGKSTQIYLVKRWLELEGYKVFFTEWNSSLLVRRSTKRGKKRHLLTPTTFALIHCTDFADRYERQILPMLHAGYIVVADRYIYTAFARDAARGCSREWIRKLYGYARHPDLTIFFDVPLNVALKRILTGRPQLKFYEAGMDMGLSKDPFESFQIFQGRVYEEYQHMVDEFDFVQIDATRSPGLQQREVRDLLQKDINLSRYRWKIQTPTSQTTDAR